MCRRHMTIQLFLALKIGFERSISASLLRAVKASAGACFLVRIGGVTRLVGGVLCLRLFVRYFRPLLVCASHLRLEILRVLRL